MAFDFTQLKSELFADNSASQDQKVEVNQRHLIDKILARYSAEFTIYRETIQNANDAGAQSVEIKFGLNEAGMVKNLTFINNGRLFDQDDWRRLRRIAEGNPNEEKIGFFGVGFYSLFSICEDPFVVSGPECMSFFWKGDQLYTRSSKNMRNSSNITCIHLELRSSLALPNLDSLAQFCSKSLLFTGSIQNVTTYINDELQFSLRKKPSPPERLALSTYCQLVNKSFGIFTLPDLVENTSVQLDFDKRYQSQETHKDSLNIFSKIFNALRINNEKEEFRKSGSWTIFYSLISCSLQATCSKKFTESFERITKKKPSKHVPIYLLFSTKDEIAVMSDNIGKHPVLSNVSPFPDNGRVFIGFETHQTTGLGFHINAPFIPTVERESLDFVDGTLKVWNEDLFGISGWLMRLIYDQEAFVLTKPKLKTEEVIARFRHLFQVFSFKPSSPSSIPSSIICDSFFTCMRSPIMLPSSVGIRPANELRKVSSELKEFLKMTPQIILNDYKVGERFFQCLFEYITFNQASIADILTEVQLRQPFEVSETVAILRWLVNNKSKLSRSDLFNLAHSLKVPAGSDSCPVSLADIKFYKSEELYGKPFIPITCIAAEISKGFSSFQLGNGLGLARFTLLHWFRHMSNLDELLTNRKTAEKVLIFLSENIKNLYDEEIEELVQIYKRLAFIPTTQGLTLPSMSYFESVKLLENIPLIKIEERYRVKDEVLKLLGVKAHIPVTEIFAKLENWNCQELIEYLSTVQSDLSAHEYSLMREAVIFPDESGKLHRVSDLYLDDPVVRVLGLPTIKWITILLHNSPQVKLLSQIGLNLVIPMHVLLDSLNGKPTEDYFKIIYYFLENFNRHYRTPYDPAKVSSEFILTDTGEFCHPKHCYSDSECRILGFTILHKDLAPYSEILGVKRRPEPDKLVEKLLKLQYSSVEATNIFNYLAACQNEFTHRHWKRLQSLRFIPVTIEKKQLWKSPQEVFFSCEDPVWSTIFPQINFGTAASTFLRSAGVKDRPSVIEIAKILCIDAKDIFMSVGKEKYLEILRKLALNSDEIFKDSPVLFSTVGNSPILIGLKHIKPEDSSTQSETSTYEVLLAKAPDIYLSDDAISIQLFNILSAPREPLLENFYQELGSLWVSKAVSQSWQYTGIIVSSDESEALQEITRTRAPLLIYDTNINGSKIISNAQHLLSTIAVYQVDKIFSTRRFHSQVHQEEVSACLKDRNTLLITKKFDYFDVAYVLAKIVYQDPKLGDSLLLSTLLSTSINSLRTKGFSVDRIVPSVYQEKPPEDVVKEAEPELIPKPYKSLQPLEPLEQDDLLQRQHIKQPSDLPSSTQDEKKRPKSIVKSIMKMFKQQLKSDVPIHQPGKTLDPELINVLKDAVKACNPTNTTNFDVDIEEQKPIEPDDSNAQDFCHILPKYSLSIIGNTKGINIFLERSIQQQDAEEWINSYTAAIDSFSIMLLSLAKVFELRLDQFAIFYEPNTPVIAFNKNGSLFFGLAHYVRQLDAQTPPRKLLASWYLVKFSIANQSFICSVHNEIHEFYMSSYLEGYFEKLIDYGRL